MIEKTFAQQIDMRKNSLKIFLLALLAFYSLYQNISEVLAFIKIEVI